MSNLVVTNSKQNISKLNQTHKEIKRISYLDILKGIGIIMMIMGHIGFGSEFDYYIHAFHMPLFFIVSGFLRKDNKQLKLLDIVIKKSKSMLVPYLFFGIFDYILFVINNLNSNEELLKPLKNLFFFNNEGLPIAGALWFLTAIFLTEIIYEIISRTLKNKYFLVICTITLSIIGIFIPIKLPFSLQPALVGVGLYFIGICLKKYKDKINITEWKIWYIAILFIINLVLIFANGYVNMRISMYAFVPLFWVNAVMGTIGWWSISCKIDQYKESKWIKNIYNNIRFIGENSIVYLCLNQIIIKICYNITKIINIKIISKVLILISTLAILYLISYVFINTKLKVLIGKK